MTGLLALGGWVLARPGLASWGTDAIPMAPATALLFGLFGVVLWLCGSRLPLSPRTRLFGVLLSAAGTAAGLLLLTLRLRGVYWSVELLGFSPRGAIQGAAIGYASPVTALCFVLAGGSVLLLILPGVGRSWRDWTAGVGAGGLTAAALVLLLAYVFGRPLLYGGPFIPPAMNSSLAFLILGLSLLVLGGRDVARPLAHPSADVSHALPFVLMFVALAGGTSALGYGYYRRVEQQFRQEVERQLLAISELKTNQLVEWRQERSWDAAFLYQNADLVSAVRRFVLRPGDGVARRDVQEWLGKFQNPRRYDRTSLIDAQGATLTSVPESGAAAVDPVLQPASGLAGSGQIAIRDFYRDPRDERVRLAVMVPIVDRIDGERLLGVVVLAIDPAAALYPLVRYWPTASRTADTVLVRREGNDALFLNPSRFRTDAALTERVPLTALSTPVARAALGQTGIVDGPDQRGVPVVAAIRSVPDSPWFIVTSMDLAEVYGPLRERLWPLVLLTGVLLVVEAGGIGALQWQQRMRQYRRQHALTTSLHESQTEQRRLEQALRDSAARFTGLYESGHDAILLLNGDSIVDCNLVAERLLGRDKVGIVGRSALDFVPAVQPSGRPSSDLAAEHIRAALAGQSQFVEWRATRPDGTAVDTELSLTRVSIGGRWQLQAVIRDITDRKRTEGTLRMQGAALNAAADAIVITDRAGVIEWVNPAFTRLTGYTSEEAEGRNPRELVNSGQQPPAFFAALWETILGGRTWHGEIVNRRKDGSLYTEDEAVTPILDAAGGITHFVAIKRDITERLQLEAQFRQAQKMESVGRLASGIAHDFNNLLTVINGMSELVLEGTKPEEPAYADLQEIHSAGVRAATLTRQLLAFSRQQILEPRVVDLNVVLASLEGLLERLLGEDIDLVITPAPGLGRVTADPGQLEQVITNLAVNARDAMPDGGQLTIEACDITIDADYARHHGAAVPPGAYVQLVVSDTGTGMDETTRARIFEPFFTTKEPGKGTGLGLSTVYGIVKQSLGFVWVYSEVGHGTTFKICLPQVDETPSAGQAEATVVQRGGTETILLVEDDAGMRKVATRFLEPAGYSVLAAASGDEAVRLMSQRQEPVDLLLTDVVMPGMTGRQLAERLAEAHPAMKVLYMSGYTGDAVVRRGVLDAQMAFLTKPFTAKALQRKVREVLDS